MIIPSRKRSKPFKIHCSQIGNIISEPRGKADKAAGELSSGAKTYVETWLREQKRFYNKRKEFTSKYTEKGHRVEQESIDFICEWLPDAQFLAKNDETLWDDHMVGTPDIITPELIWDVKNSWDVWTFPIFTFAKVNPRSRSKFDTMGISSEYWYQAQGYMALTGAKSYRLVYILTDLPDDMVAAEARKVCYAKKVDFDSEEANVIFEQTKKKFTFSNKPPHLRIKQIKIDRNDAAIKWIRNRVEAARKYIEKLEREVAEDVFDTFPNLKYNPDYWSEWADFIPAIPPLSFDLDTTIATCGTIAAISDEITSKAA